jgi:hypothetical protein
MGGLVVLSQAVIDASNTAKDRCLNSKDPDLPADARGQVPRRLSGPWHNDFFRRLYGLFHNFGVTLEASGSFDRMDAFGRIFSLVLDLNSLLDVSNSNLVLGAHPPPYLLDPTFKGELDRNPSVGFGILNYLLQLGFYTPETSSMGGALMAPREGCDDVFHVFGPDFCLQSAMSNQATDRSFRGNRLFAYRGESRPPERVKEQDGVTCRADLVQWRKDSNVNKPWHPWNDTSDNLSRMWIRRGNGDNDFLTVNSIAMDFHIGCAYPMFHSNEIDPVFRGDINNWTPEMRMKLRASQRANFCLIAKSDGNEVYVLFDIAYVYVYLLPETQAVSPTYTARQQGDRYPECGIRKVQLNSVIAWFKIQRFHVPPADDESYCHSTAADPVAMTIRVQKCEWMHGPIAAKNALGLEDPGLLQSRMNSLVGKKFDIAHSRLVRETDTYFDPSTVRFPPTPEYKPVRLTGR